MAQRGVRENVAERTFDPGQEFIRFALRNHCTFTVLSKCTDSDTLAM
jgi:hypothetical protein